jgi:hypothetical protein
MLDVMHLGRWARTGLCVVGALVLASSCGSKDSGDVSALVEQTPFTKAVAGVEVGGKLILVANRCVGFVWQHNEPTVIVFPAGTSVTGRGQDVVIHVNGETLSLGDGFAAGTWGPVATSVAGLEGSLVDPVPEACRDSPVVSLNQFQR